MKTITLIATLAVTSFFYAQEISIKEENISFSNGSHNAIVVTIPYGNKETVERELKSELKDWGGKYNSSKGEMTTKTSSMKSMGSKPFDGYARIMDGGDNYIRVAFAIDLGGAYLDSRQHASQYAAMKERIQKFASKGASSSIEAELAVEAKVLKELEENKSDMQKSIESSKKDIEDYKKKIEEAEQKIKDNEAGINKKEEEIKTQSAKIGTIEDKKKSVK